MILEGVLFQELFYTCHLVLNLQVLYPDEISSDVFQMGKFMKQGKVVLVLAGRYAGRKAIVIKVHVVNGSSCDSEPKKILST